MPAVRKTARILLVVLLLALTSLACITGGGGGGIDPLDLTATVGAEVFYRQLTAIAPGGN